MVRGGNNRTMVAFANCSYLAANAEQQKKKKKKIEQSIMDGLFPIFLVPFFR